MGFMAGFGSAFADSFNQQQKISGDLKSDKMRLDYQDALSRRQTIEKQDKANAQAMKLAKEIVRSTGQPDEAVGTAYNILANGGSEEQVWKQFRENQASVVKPSGASAVSDGSGPADPRDDLTQGAQGAVDSQMAASGMKQPAPNTGLFGKTPQAIDGSAQIPQTDTGATPRPSADVGPTAQPTVGNNQQPDQVTQVAQNQSQSQPQSPPVTGEPVVGDPEAGNLTWAPRQAKFDSTKVNNLGDAIYYDEWAKTNGTPQQKMEASNLLDRFQHAKATEANLNAQANGTGFTYARGFIKDANGGYTGGVAIPHDNGMGGYNWTDAKGNPVDQAQVLPVDKNMEADIKAVSTEMSKPLQDYEQAKQDYKTTARTSAEISKLAKEHPEAMGLSGDISQASDALRRAGINVAKIISPKLDPEGNIVPDAGALGELEKSEQVVNGMIKGTVDRNAQNALYATLLDIKTTRLAYMWAKDMGQQGRGVSNADFKNFKDVAKGGGNPAALQQSAADFLGEKLRSLHDQESSLTKGGGAGAYFSQKYPNVPNPFKVTSTIDDEIKGDPELSGSVDQVNDNSQPNPTGQMDNSDADIPDMVKQNKAVDFGGQPISVDAWKYLPKEVQDALKKKNGIQ